MTSYTLRMLLCPIRGCRKELWRTGPQFVCPQGHSFDVAKSGYINLLQTHQRRSKNPGDSVEAVAARRRLHDRGVTAPLLTAIADTLSASKSDTVLDAGCGDGFFLGSLHRDIDFDAHGVDISIPAVNAAARRYPGCEWIVANADTFVPYSDDLFSIVLSITARMNAAEFRRVLRPDGKLLVALAAPDDLIELRGVGRDRVERTVGEFAPAFKLIEQRRATTTADLDAAAAQDVLVSIYRPLRATPVEAMSVTFSLDLLLFEAG